MRKLRGRGFEVVTGYNGSDMAIALETDTGLAAVISAAQRLPDPETHEREAVAIAVYPSVSMLPIGEVPSKLVPVVYLTFEKRLFNDGGKRRFLWECAEHAPGRFFSKGGE